MSLPIWTDGSYYPRASVIFFADQQGISISGVPSRYRVAAASEVSCTGAIGGDGSSFNVEGVGGGVVTSSPQRVNTSISGQPVTITTASVRINVGIRAGATQYPPDNTGGSITLSISGNKGRWLVVPQVDPPGVGTAGQYSGGSLIPFSEITLSGDYLGDGWNYNVKNYAIIPLIKNDVYVMLDAAGGTCSPAILEVTVGGTYSSLPTPARSGYLFSGWYTAASGGTQVTDSTVVTNAQNHTLHAQWATSAQHVLYFNATGGTVSPASTSVTEGQAYGTLPTPMMSGYTFAGWYTRATGGEVVTAATVAGDDDATIYAHWTGESLTITFDANGGTVSEATRTVVRGDQYRRLPIPVRNGYNFDGWYTAASGGTLVTAADCPTTSHTLYARWSDGSVAWWHITFN